MISTPLSQEIKTFKGHRSPRRSQSCDRTHECNISELREGPRLTLPNQPQLYCAPPKRCSYLKGGNLLSRKL